MRHQLRASARRRAEAAGIPTLVATYGNAALSGTTPKTASVTTAVGDTLVVYAGTSDSTRTVSTPTGGTGLAWTLRQSIAGVTGRGCAYIWTATATTAETFTLSINGTNLSGGQWTFACLRFSGVGAIGAGLATSATATGSVTTSAAGAAIVTFLADWNGVDGTTRAWSTATAGAITETTYLRIAGISTVFGGVHINAGAAGAKTVGLTAPTGLAPSLVAVALLAA